MLVLTRRIGQQIRIAETVEVKVLEIIGNKVRLGISAPRDMPVHREEVFQRLGGDACLSQAFGTEMSDADTAFEMNLVVAK